MDQMSIVYKQYNGETGSFELSMGPNNDVRFLDDVHITFVKI